MPKFETHCADCVRELGEPFEEVHLWMDELFKYVGSEHRDIRHNEKGIAKVRKMWGDRAAQAAIIHIMADEGKIPETSDPVFQIRMAFNQTIHQALIKEFENEVDIES